ncbi:cytochrome P450 [Exidia glandulosa HHB12029]|uniref:Cytochrome P450 n=1 Tax=Exidia glandulosa HHB12029 TaxID=1314781 RepID=A0A165QSS1_EXIGL|nr:cytochrome P450 [Exidia glandulosa HHB12029]
MLEAIPAARTAAVAVGIAGAGTLVLCASLRYLRPLLARKNEPPTLSYWIPWLGHALWYMRDARGLVDAAHEIFGSYSPFAVVLGGQKIYIVSDPPDVKAVYRAAKSLNFEPITAELVGGPFGMGAAAAKLREAPPGEPNLITIAHPFFRDELTSRPRVQIISERYLTALEGVMSGFARLFKEADTQTVEVPMWRWCREVVFTASTNGIFGPMLIKQHPELFDVYNAFDEEFYKLVFQFPDSHTVDVRKHRAELLDMLVEFYSDMKTVEETAGDVISKWQQQMIARSGMNPREMAAGALSLFWGFNTNSLKTSFWMILFICSTPKLAARLRSEFAPAFVTQSSLPNTDYLTKECPLLDATFRETLRLATAPSSMRLVEEDTEIGGYTFYKGNRVLLPSMHLHRAKHFWGEDADSFRPERILEIGDKVDIVQSGYLRPFGGGTSYCPGRIFSRSEIMAFVTLVLHRYDLELLGPVPVPNTGPPTLGVLDPPMPCDLGLKLTRRY